MREIDQDAVLRARVLLLGSGRLRLFEQVRAYRVLAVVSPKVYLPKLVDALLSMIYRSWDPEVDLALGAEAVEAARRIEAGAPAWAERLCTALDAYQAALFALGRRTEGRAACEEMAEAGQSGRLANVLAEEGRFREAAELNEKAARNGVPEHSFWSMVEWAANLEGAGLHDEALAVFGELLDETRRKAAGERTAQAILTWELVHFSRMREAAGRGADAAAAGGRPWPSFRSWRRRASRGTGAASLRGGYPVRPLGARRRAGCERRVPDAAVRDRPRTVERHAGCLSRQPARARSGGGGTARGPADCPNWWMSSAESASARPSAKATTPIGSGSGSSRTSTKAWRSPAACQTTLPASPGP
ncbi:hypothetical protein [Streptomyces sp. NPDC054975]